MTANAADLLDKSAVSIPKRVSEVLKLCQAIIEKDFKSVSIPKRVSEVLKPCDLMSEHYITQVSIPKRVSEVLKPLFPPRISSECEY